MPSPASLARDLALLRTGHGPSPRQAALREALNGVDAELRRQRNVEALKLADAKVRLRMQDTRRGDPAALHAAVEASTRRLVALDQRIVEAVAAVEGRAQASGTVLPARPAEPDLATVLEARAVMRAKLTVASAQLEHLLPAGATRLLQRAIAAQIAKLSR